LSDWVADEGAGKGLSILLVPPSPMVEQETVTEHYRKDCAIVSEEPSQRSHLANAADANAVLIRRREQPRDLDISASTFAVGLELRRSMVDTGGSVLFDNPELGRLR
jgi:hypothetical protein